MVCTRYLHFGILGSITAGVEQRPSNRSPAKLSVPHLRNCESVSPHPETKQLDVVGTPFYISPSNVEYWPLLLATTLVTKAYVENLEQIFLLKLFFGQDFALLDHCFEVGMQMHAHMPIL